MLFSDIRTRDFASTLDDVCARGRSLVRTFAMTATSPYTSLSKLLHPPLSTNMTDLGPINRVGLSPEKASTPVATESAIIVGKMEESTSNSETSNSKIPAGQQEDRSKEKVCGVCNDHEARYKCSRCQLP